MSLVLGIQTSGESASCAVGNIAQEKNIAQENIEAKSTTVEVSSSFEIAEPQRHCENLVPLIQKSLKKSGIDIHDIDLIVVDVGPGLYTGLRVGIATAQFLAYGLQAKGKETKCLGISSLDLLAFQFLQKMNADFSKDTDFEKTVKLFSVIDAKRGEVFYASYNMSENGFTQKYSVTQKYVATPQELTKLEGKKICIGDGALLYKDIFKEAGCEVVGETLNPEALIQFAATFDSASYVSPQEVQPIYLRKPDIQ